MRVCEDGFADAVGDLVEAGCEEEEGHLRRTSEDWGGWVGGERHGWSG